MYLSLLSLSNLLFFLAQKNVIVRVPDGRRKLERIVITWVKIFNVWKRHSGREATGQTWEGE